MFEKLLEDTSFWSGIGQLSDTVLSTRVRLIRNMADVPFSEKQSEGDLEKIIEPVNNFIYSAKIAAGLEKTQLSEIDNLDRRFLRERNLLTKKAENNSDALLIYRLHTKFSMIVNADDHYYLQVIRPGLNIYDAYGELVEADEGLNNFTPYAFSERFGYLTSSLDNTGTGLKVSVLMHLPCLGIMGTIDEVIRMVTEIGAVLEPVTVTQKDNFGSFYLISNSETIGKNESDILEVVDDSARMVAGLETESREEFYMNSPLQLEDMAARSYGILKYVRKISYVEALEHLSNIRLGVILSIIKNVSLEMINDLFVKIQPAHLVKLQQEIVTQHDKAMYDKIRADFLRSQL
jgi:protein arginine kinase